MTHQNSAQPPAGEIAGTLEPRGGGKTESARREWEPIRLQYLGKILDLIRGGGGKLSLAIDGDGRKPFGAG